MLRRPLVCLASTPLSLLLSLSILLSSLTATPIPPLIIHAGGRIDGVTGTNSLEALEETYAVGGRAIEIDFDWTSDGHLVCIHDFTDRFTTQLNGEPCTLEEFLNIRYLNSNICYITLKLHQIFAGCWPTIYPQGINEDA